MTQPSAGVRHAGPRQKDTPLEIKTDGEALIICPLKKATTMDRALEAADELMDAHDATFQKLAK